MSRPRSSLALASVLLVLAVGSAALAQAPGSAQEQFAAATKLFETRKFAEALPRFEQLARETGSPNARLYVARCLTELGRLGAAYDELSATVRDAAERAEKEAKYAPTRDAAAAELAILERRVARVLVSLPDAPKGTTITLDGVPIPREKVGVAISANPGRLRLEARTPDGQRVAEEVVVGPGEIKSVILAFPSARPAPSASAPAVISAPPPPPSAPPPPERRTGMRTAGYAVLGVGAAGLVTFVVAGLAARSKHDKLVEACGDASCPDGSHQGDIDTGRTYQTVANVGLLVGVAGGVTGSVLLYLSRDRTEGPRATVSLAPGGGFVGYRAPF